MANEDQTYRGAVEPAETTPSGNEMQAWRGAVEPTEPVGGNELPIFHYFYRQQD